jgi:hypothetical protein
MTADGKQICCHARAAGYSLDVVRAGLEEAIVISRCEHTSVGTHSILTPLQMSHIFPPLYSSPSSLSYSTMGLARGDTPDLLSPLYRSECRGSSNVSIDGRGNGVQIGQAQVAAGMASTTMELC